MFIVIDHNGRPLELVNEYGQLVLMCGVRVTAFADRKTARRHMANTQAWAEEKFIYWHHRVPDWRILPLSLSPVKRRHRAA